MCTCEDEEPNATCISPMPDQLVSDPKIKLSSLKMDATSVSSKVDPDIVMTDPCSHRVGQSGVCVTLGNPTPHIVPQCLADLSGTPNEIIHITSLKMDTTSVISKTDPDILI